MSLCRQESTDNNCILTLHVSTVVKKCNSGTVLSKDFRNRWKHILFSSFWQAHSCGTRSHENQSGWRLISYSIVPLSVASNTSCEVVTFTEVSGSYEMFLFLLGETEPMIRICTQHFQNKLQGAFLGQCI